MTNVIVVIGAGPIGQAIARRISSGKHVLLADLRKDTANAAAKVLSEAGLAHHRERFPHRWRRDCIVFLR